MKILKTKKIRSYAGRFVFSGIILFYLLRKIDFDALEERLSSLRLEYIIIAIVPGILEMILKSLKWQMLLKVKNISTPLTEIIKIYYVSGFLSKFLPSSLSIDFFRTYSLSKQINNAHDSISTVFIDRIIGILSLIFVVSFGILAIKTEFVDNALISIIILICICLLGITLSLLLFTPLLVILEPLLRKLRIKNFDGEKITRTLREIYKSIISFRQYKSTVFNVFIVSIFFQMNRIAITYIVALALDIDIGFPYWVVIVPLVTLATMLPIAVGGLGVREGAFVFFLNQLGVNVSTAFALSLVIFFLGNLLILPGLIFYFKSGIVSAKRVAPSQ